MTDPAGPSKATVSAIGALLKPGKSIQSSIDDNRWIGKATSTSPLIAGFARWLQALLGLPEIEQTQPP